MARDLADGEVAYVQGSAAKPYEIKNTGGVYACTCPAWRNQSLAIERRTCKHIRKLRGESAEAARVGKAAPATATKKAKAKDEVKAPPVLLAQKWEPHVDVTGWWLSEKLDGVRAYWDGSQFLSRLGNVFHAPAWFTETLPGHPLDGELWVGRGQFQRTVSIVRRQDKGTQWRDVSFLIFDAPQHGGVFEDRIQWLRDTIETGTHPHAAVVDHEVCLGTEHVVRRLREIEALGGEGLMAREPGSEYVAGRSHSLLKIKSFQDAEARVIGHVPGAGRHKGRLGALEVVLADGTRFSVGTGLSDKERAEPPAIGAIITFRYQELSNDGVPRFPSYVGVRDDVVWSNDEPKRKRRGKAAGNSAGEVASDTANYFELSDGKSNKFWEIRVDGASHTVRYGRIGSKGTSKTKTFETPAAAKSDAKRLRDEKTRKGYVVATPPGE